MQNVRIVKNLRKTKNKRNKEKGNGKIFTFYWRYYNKN